MNLQIESMVFFCRVSIWRGDWRIIFARFARVFCTDAGRECRSEVPKNGFLVWNSCF